MSLSVLGIDIAKQKMEVALLVTGKVKNKSFKNSPDGFGALALWLRKWNIERVHACLEATGNYGEDLATFLYEAGHTVSVVNPARIKGFAQSELIRTKTDKIDAGIIARFCRAMKPEPWVPPSPEIRSLRALVRRADGLNDMLTQEKNRLDTAHESVIPLIQEHIDYLDKENDKIRDQIAALIDRNPDLKRKKDLLASIPGIGQATIATLLAELDDLGRFKHVRELKVMLSLRSKR
jgi:transposase